MSCQYTVGLLSMRPCGAPAASACSFCGSPLCAAHAMPGSSGAPACPGCASVNEGYESNDDTEFASAREEYYSPYGGTASFGQEGYFSDSELAALSPALQPRGKSALQKFEEDEDDYDPRNS